MSYSFAMIPKCGIPADRDVFPQRPVIPIGRFGQRLYKNDRFSEARFAD
jgi:hypothetical protein